MIKIGSCNHQTPALAINAKRVLRDVGLSGLLPLVAVTTLGAVLALTLPSLRLKALADIDMLIAVARVASQLPTALSAARFLWP